MGEQLGYHSGLEDLSESGRWENSSAITRVYKLRQNVRFHDGSALTAEDVVFSYRRAMQSSPWSELLKVIRDIATPDSYNVVFTMYPDRMSTYNPQIWTLPIIVPARVYGADPKRFITNPVGCGPFIAELNQNGQSGIVQLRAFEQYYLGKPRLKNLSIALQPDINVLFTRLVAGELNAIVVPDTEDAALAGKLKPLEEKYQIIRTTRGQRKVVHLQERSLRERLPNNYDNRNAHLWYF